MGIGYTWACKRFRNYLIGLSYFTFQTDDKPSTTLFGNKNLDKLFSRIQRFRMRLMWFCFKVMYVPVKLLSTADTLSLSPVSCVESSENNLLCEIENHVDCVIAYLPASNSLLQKFVMNLYQITYVVYK